MKVNGTAIFKNTMFKRAVTQLGKSGALLPVVLLEIAVDTGRSYQAYKRGGATEMRERATDDISAGIFWLFGAVGLNKVGDWIGKKFLGIKKPAFSLGKDKARNGLEQALEANKGVSARKLSLFKLSKVVSSIAIAIAFIGWVLPKVNQAITRKKMEKQKTISGANGFNGGKGDDTPKSTNPGNDIPSWSLTVLSAKNLFDEFENYKKNKKNDEAQRAQNNAFKGKKNPNFGINMLSPEFIGKVAHNLEHDATWRLGSTDGGILVGRTTNARTFDEGLEYGVRDACSSYFYLWAPAHIIALCNKFDKFGGFNTKLDPVSATHVSNYLANIVGDSKIPVEEFKKQMFGSTDETRFNLIKPTLDKNGGNISVEDFCKMTGADEALSKKARLMSRLQPKMNDVAILTDNQARDVLNTGKISDPKFLYRTINRYFADTTIMGKKAGKHLQGTISDGLKFESISDIEKLRGNIGNYVQSVIEIAKNQAKNAGDESLAEVSLDTIKKAAKRNTIMHSGYLAAGLGVSILFLSTLIPKFQYWITKMRTGKDGFPGVEGQQTK